MWLAAVPIDLLLDREDRVLNMCEIKYNGGIFAVDKAYHQVLSNRQMILASKISPKKVRANHFFCVIPDWVYSANQGGRLLPRKFSSGG